MIASSMTKWVARHVNNPARMKKKGIDILALY